MKSGSRTSVIMVGLALAIAFVAAVPTRAQNRERYLISASAGGINLVSGNVTVTRRRTNRQEALTDSDNLRSGDSVTTGAGGRVEVLLNPGTYMRVDENSEFELTSASLDNLLVKIVRGSVVVEVTGADGVDLALGFYTRQADALIIKGGIYRFNILPNETTEILVRKGKLLYGKPPTAELKGGKKVVIGRGILEVVKLDKKDQDSLDLWSKDRAQLLARANRRLENRTLLTAFNDFGWNDPYGWRRPWNDTLGFWVYSPSTRSHCFVPMGGRSWSSPYGHTYGTGVGYGNNGGGWRGGAGYQPGGNGPNPSGGGGSQGGNSGGNSNPAPAPAPAPQPVSPPSPPQPAMSESERAPRQDYRTPN